MTRGADMPGAARNPTCRAAMTRLLAAASLLCAHGTIAAYPERPLRFIVPVAAGGGNDIVARLLGQKLTAAWGQQVVVDNRPGAAMAIGAELTARASPDGYTIMIVSASFAINAAVQPKLPFDPIADFAPVTLLARVPQILVINPGVAARSLAEFIALARAQPGRLNYASAGAGSSTHLAMLLFSDMARVSLNHVPYKGTAPGLADVIAGHVQVTFDAIPPALAHVNSGRVRALAVANPRRFPSLADVPTFAQAGLPDYTFASWFAVLAPARTPPAIIEQLNRELVRIVQLAETRERFTAMGIEPLGTSPQETAQHLRREIAQWTKLARQHDLVAH